MQRVLIFLLLSFLAWSVAWTATQTITYPSALVSTYNTGGLYTPEFDISVDGVYHFACSSVAAYMYKFGGSTYSLQWTSTLGGIFGSPFVNSNCKVASDVEMTTKYLTITSKDGSGTSYHYLFSFTDAGPTLIMKTGALGILCNVFSKSGLFWAFNLAASGSSWEVYSNQGGTFFKTGSVSNLNTGFCGPFK